MSRLKAYIEQYGPEAGPKIDQILRSRAAYKGVSTRRRHQIESLTGRPFRVRRSSKAAPNQALLPLAEISDSADPSTSA